MILTIGLAVLAVISMTAAVAFRQKLQRELYSRRKADSSVWVVNTYSDSDCKVYVELWRNGSRRRIGQVASIEDPEALIDLQVRAQRQADTLNALGVN